MYSASVVDNAVMVCILDAQVMGAPAKQTIQPEQDLEVIGSTWASLKSASTQQSKCHCLLGWIISPLSHEARR